MASSGCRTKDALNANSEDPTGRRTVKRERHFLACRQLFATSPPMVEVKLGYQVLGFFKLQVFRNVDNAGVSPNACRIAIKNS